MAGWLRRMWAEVDEGTKSSPTLQRLAQSPLTTVTGPLGFGVGMLWYQLHGVSAQIQRLEDSQAELQGELKELGVKTDYLEKAYTNRDRELVELKAAIATNHEAVQRLADRLDEMDSKRRR